MSQIFCRPDDDETEPSLLENAVAEAEKLSTEERASGNKAQYKVLLGANLAKNTPMRNRIQSEH